MTAEELLKNLVNFIVNPIIILGFIIATIFLFWGIVELIWKSDDSGDLQTNKTNITYGVIGLFVMFSVYGILRIALETFKIPCGFFFC